MKPYEAYIESVLSGERTTGRLERLTVERFCRLRVKPEYVFDEDTADYILNILSHLKLTKGKYYGKKWELLPWQSFFFAYIFGLKYKDSGLRVVRKVLLCMAKKGGKSEVGGALGVLMSFFDDEHSAQCYSAANKYDQAKFCWDAAKEFLKQLAQENEYIASNLKIYDSITTRSILNQFNSSFFKPIAADAKTLDGVDPHLGIIDEYHEAQDDSIPNNLESGMVARLQPLLAIVTTRGFNSNGVLRQIEDRYIEILEGKMENDSVFPMIFSLDDGDDWQDEVVWVKANPGIGVIPTWEGIREQYKKAITEGATSEVNFKTKNMNIWTNVASVWIQDDIWMSGATEYRWEDLAGRECYGGLDLASTRDIAAFTMLFPPIVKGEPYKQLTRYYCPKERIRERSRKDRVPYEQWEKDGWLIATPGNQIDYEYIEEDIYEAAAFFDLKGISYDPFNGSKVLPNLIASGLSCNGFTQSPGNFTAPVKELERVAIGRTWMKTTTEHAATFPDKIGEFEKYSELPERGEPGQWCVVDEKDSAYIWVEDLFDQGKDPIMRWMAGNVVVFTSRHGNIKFDKEKCRDKIDGMVSLAMAFGEYLDQKEDESEIYKDREDIIFF